ncbi:restriction endonuclease subunit S [Myroides sp. C4067]|uniref:restriction endonuclease subunit S n=1 Tax=Myroides sp. C4067 TaxID=3136765 RepID=UPI003100B6F6
MSYKRLGDYVQLVNDRNKDLKVDTLLGVSITKRLIPSIANTIGTDMSTYKIIERGQFAYGTVTSRNGEKISIALADEYDKALVSQIYVVFEVIDKNILLPEYLMMWFSRPEFDRFARYHSHGSTRETFDWDDMCEVELPVPSIERQREIVGQYQAVGDKIKVNEQICEKLEAIAQTLYKQWFVDFEFPNEEGLPYKSSGGLMEYNEELEKEVPVGWEVKSLGEVTNISAGGDKPKVYSDVINAECNIPIYSNSTDNYGLFGYTNMPKIIKPSITVSARGAIIGYTLLRKYPFVPIVRLITITPYDDEVIYYLFKVIERFKYDDNGSAQGQLTVPEVSMMNILYPTNLIIKGYYKKYKEIDLFIDNYKKQSQKFVQLQSLMLSRMVGGE